MRTVLTVSGFFLLFPLLTVGASEEQVLPLKAMLLFPETGEIIDCSAIRAVSVDITEACLQATPQVVVPTSTVIGWRSRAVYDTHISESCGMYRAQDGHIACELPFGGSRQVNWVGLIICACSDPSYTTTGVIHNYDMEAEIMYWGAFKDNAAFGHDYEECSDFILYDSRTTGVTGGIHNNDAHNSHCFIRWTDVKGTWGISVDYKRTADDASKVSSHVYVHGG